MLNAINIQLKSCYGIFKIVFNFKFEMIVTSVLFKFIKFLCLGVRGGDL